MSCGKMPSLSSRITMMSQLRPDRVPSWFSWPAGEWSAQTWIDYGRIISFGLSHKFTLGRAYQLRTVRSRLSAVDWWARWVAHSFTVLSCSTALILLSRNKALLSFNSKRDICPSMNRSRVSQLSREASRSITSWWCWIRLKLVEIQSSIWLNAALSVVIWLIRRLIVRSAVFHLCCKARNVLTVLAATSMIPTIEPARPMAETGSMMVSALWFYCCQTWVSGNLGEIFGALTAPPRSLTILHASLV